MKNFSDDLRRSLDELAPSQDELMRIAKKGRRKTSRPWAKAAVAACLALVLVLGGIGVYHFLPAVSPGQSPLFSENGSTAAKDYQQILAFLNSSPPKQAEQKDTVFFGWTDGDLSEDFVQEGVVEGAPMEPAPGMADGNASQDRFDPSGEVARPSDETPEFSDTNLQHQGVNEGDVVKTDGKAVYLLRNNVLCVIPVQSQSPSAVFLTVGGSEKTGDFEKTVRSAEDLYLLGDRLVILIRCLEKKYTPDRQMERKQASLEEEYTRQYRAMSDPGFTLEEYLVEMGLRDECGFPSYYEYEANKTLEESLRAVILDVSDPQQPARLEEIGISGVRVDTRAVGNVLYLISRQEIPREFDATEPSAYVPTLYDAEGRRLMSAEDIYLSSGGYDRTYLNVLSYDVQKQEQVDRISVIGAGTDLYASPDNLYVLGRRTVSEIDEERMCYLREDRTFITRISYHEGKLSLASQTGLEGNYRNSFFFDEQDGYLRVVLRRNSSVCRVESYGALDRLAQLVQGEWSGGYIRYGNADYRALEETLERKNDTVLTVLDLSLREVGRLEGLAHGEELKSVRFENNTVYFVTYLQVDPLFAIDVSDPTSPKRMGELKVPGYSDYLQSFGEGRLLGFGVTDAGQLKLSMFDVSRPDSLQELATLAVPDAYYSDALQNHKALLADAQKKLVGFATKDGYRLYTYTEDDGNPAFMELAVLRLDSPSEMDRGIYVGERFFCLGMQEYAVYSMGDWTECTREKFPQKRLEFTVDWNGNGGIDQ